MFNRNNGEQDLLTRRVKECKVFSGLGDGEIKSLLKISHVRDYSAGEKIFAEGTIGLCFYIIVKGTVNIITDDAGEISVLRELNEGDYFSEVHLFSESTHTVSCVAKDVTKLIIFAKPDFNDFVNINPKTGNKILLRFLDFFGEKLDLIYKENKELKQNIKI